KWVRSTCDPARAAHPPIATSAPPRNHATAGIRSATSVTSTPTGSCTSQTAGSPCPLWAAATCPQPRSKPPALSIRMCCPAWLLVCHMKIWGRCHMPWFRPGRHWTSKRCKRFCVSASLVTRCPRPLSSSTPRYVMTPARRAAPRSATRSWRDCVFLTRADGIATSWGGGLFGARLPVPQRFPARRFDERIAHRGDGDTEHQRQRQHLGHVSPERELTDHREHHRQRGKVPDEDAVGPASERHHRRAAQQPMAFVGPVEDPRRDQTARQ